MYEDEYKHADNLQETVNIKIELYKETKIRVPLEYMIFLVTQ